MQKSLLFKTITILFFLILILFSYNKITKKKEVVNNEMTSVENDNYNSNIIRDVSYLSKDSRGNEYIFFGCNRAFNKTINLNVLFDSDFAAYTTAFRNNGQ